MSSFDPFDSSIELLLYHAVETYKKPPYYTRWARSLAETLFGPTYVKHVGYFYKGSIEVGRFPACLQLHRTSGRTAGILDYVAYLATRECKRVPYRVQWAREIMLAQYGPRFTACAAKLRTALDDAATKPGYPQGLAHSLLPPGSPALIPCCAH